MGTRYRGIALRVFGAWGKCLPLFKIEVSRPKKSLLMKSPIFFSKGRTVRFWIQIVLVLALVRIAVVPSALYANPTGEQVVGGAAGFNRPDAATLIVNQNTDRAVINWNSFSIANGELTRFVQPSSRSAVLNRVVTANPSAIYGTLQANGNVYLINPGGVLVGAGGVVNTASFVASTQDINTEEFMKGGHLNFKGNSDASIVNQGNITARDGDVFLIAKEVKNEGQLMAKDGTVGMVSGTEVSLQAVGQGNFKVRLMAAETDPTSPRTSQGEGGASKGSAEIVNEGVIQAANAVLEAKGSYLPMAIKNTGVIEATGLVENGDGSVTLTGGEGDILNTGVVAALQRSLDGVKETGGSIMITAKNVTSDLGAVITAAGRDGGGIIKIESKDTTMLAGRAEVTGSSDMARGGRAEIMGRRVGLRAGEVNADGGAGGGTILVGGDYLGKNPTIQNAEATVLGPDASISASATKNGDGGRVILWSDEYTGSFGNIDAKGGIEGGNGGFVETSSKMNLSILGFVDVGAPKGSGGAWLLDPADIEITGNVVQPANFSTLLTSPPFEPSPTSPYSAEILFGTAASPNVPVGLSQVSADLITFGLSQGDVLLQANNSIIVSTAITSEIIIAPGSGSSPARTSPYRAVNDLTLESGGYIIVNDGIEIYGGITLNSNSGSPSTGPTSPIKGDITVNRAITSINAGITLLVNTPTLANQLAGDVILNSTLQSAFAGQIISISSPDGTITLNSNITTAGTGTLNLSTGSSTLDGGEIIQVSGTITVGTLNVTTRSDTPGAFIYLGTSLNDVDSVSLRTLTQNDVNQDALIYYRDFDGFNIDGNGIRTANNVTLQGGDTSASDIGQINSATVEALGLGIVTAGSVTLDDTSNDIRNLAVDLRNPGDGGPGDLSFTDADGFNVAFVTTDFIDSTLTDTTTKGIRADDVRLTAENGVPGNANGIRLRNTPGDRTEITANTQYLTLGGLPIDSPVSPGHIESSGNVTITVRQPAGTLAGNFDNRFTLDEGIHLFAGMDSDFTGFDNTRLGSHGIVTIYANNMVIGMDTDPNLAMHGLIMTQDINQADVINPGSGVFLAPYGSTVVGPPDTPSFARGVQIVSAKADYNITPDPGFFQLTNGELNRINTSRLQIRSAFTDTTGVITPAIDVRSSLSMNGLYDISTISTGSGLFPNTPGANRLELWASGGAGGNVQVSADISSDATSTTSTTPTPMQIFLSAAVAGNGARGGVVNVNAGIRSNGGNIALQGDNVNINALINSNNPNNALGLGLVAIFPAQTGADVNLGAKVGTGTLGILRDEIALITAGTVQLGISYLSPKVLQPTNPFTDTFLSGSNPLWQIGDLETLVGVNTGILTNTDLISGLSINTLALLSDDSNGTGTALSQDTDAGIQVSGLFVGGAPGTDTAAAPGTDYILGSNLNEIDQLGVALGTTSALFSFSTTASGSVITTSIPGQDTTGAGAPTGDLFLVNSKGLVGGNSGEVARTVQQWDQGLVRANVSSAPLYTGIGLVVAEALSITAAGPVSIYETLPTGVTGVGQYMAHVSANPNSAAQMDQTEVGNEIGALGGIGTAVGGTTVGLAVDATQNTPGSTGANNVWAAAARGLAISDLSTAFTGVTGNGGIINNGGAVTLEGNAIEIVPTVTARTTGGTITIDTTGNGIAPSGGRVVIRPATGQNGFQDRLGSGAYDPDLQNSILAGAPVEMNLGTGSTTVTAANGSGLLANPLIDALTGSITGYTILNGGSGYTTGDAVTNTGSGSGATGWAVVAAGGEVIGITGGSAGTGYGGGFLDTSLDTIWIGAPSISATAIRASAIEIGQNSIAGTATGKITISDALAFNSLAQTLKLSSGGAVETADNLTGGDTITLAGGLAVDSIGAVILRGDVDLFAVDTSGGTQSVRFIDSDEITIGNVDGVSGILGGSVFLEADGAIAQADGVTIQTTALGLRATGVGASIRLDQINDLSLVAATALKTIITITDVGGGYGGSALATVNPITGAISSIEILNGGQGYTVTTAATINGPVGSGATAGAITINAGVITGIAVNTAGTGYLTPGDVYLKTESNLAMSQVAAGAPGGTPAAVAGISGANVTLVTGGNITQDGDAPIAAAGAFLATLAAAGSATLDSSNNSFAGSPLVAALTTSGALGSVSDVKIVNNGVGGILLGQAGVINVELLTTGSGYTGAPTVNFSSGTANASPILGVGTITLSNNGSGYLSAPSVSITGGGGVGAKAEAVVDSNPLSSTYGQVTAINITNAGTGYTTLPTVTLTGGSPAQAATVTSGTAATLLLQRINLIDSGIGSNYTTTPTVTILGSGGSGATATATIGGTGGYVATSASTVTGGITGNLSVINNGGGNFADGSGFSVDGTSTFGSVGAVTLDSTLNNMLGTITVGSNGSVVINNANSSVLGNFTGANSSGVPDSTIALGGTLTLGSKGSIYQASSGALLKVTGAASFYATTTALTGGIPNGSVILNNANNAFANSISAEGTRVVIRDSTALNLGAVTASTSLSATSTSGGITQSGLINSTGAASFAAANGFSIDVGTQANTFSSTVSFAALSGTLANVTVRDATALDLQAMTLTGNLTATSAGAITDSGALVIGGTTSLIAPGQNITLDNANQFTGAVSFTGANVTLNNRVSSLQMGTGSASGNLAVTSTTAVTQSGVTTLTVGGTTSFSALGQNITLNNGNQFSGAVSLAGANVAVTDAAGLILGTTRATGTFSATATTGNITQTGALNITGASTFTGANGVSITLDQSANALTGAVSFVASSGNLGDVTLVDTLAVDLQTLTLSGNLSITSGGAVTDSGVLTIGGTTTISAAGQNITLDSASQFTGAVSLTGANVAVTDAAGLLLGTTTATGTFAATATTGNITQSGAISFTGASTFTAANGASITLGNSANAFTGAVTFASAGTLADITLADTTAFQIQNGLNISGNLALTAAGITQAGAITIGGTTTLNGGTGSIVLTNGANSYGGTVTITDGASADMFFSLADEADLGAVSTSGTFTLRTADGISFNIANGSSAGFDVTDSQLSNFNVGAFAPIATDGGDLNLGNLMSYAGIGGISLTTVGGGDINALGVINLNTLELNSSGGATFSEVNEIQNLGNVTVAVGGVTLQNSRGLNLTGTATMPGRLSLEVAGQFYNQTGQSQPLAGVAGGSVIKSLSLMGGLPNQIPGLAGFSNRYDGVMPTSGNVMSYAVSPLAMFAPSGTTIAGVDLGGTQTGGGQFNTFLTGSDNLNWMISDFGRFEMPTVKPSGMDYILYPQRVEPETRTLPAATLGQLEQELGRPPTLDEIQAREVAVREAAMVRSGAILERTSFDAVEDKTDKQDSADVPAQVIDGGKPQAGGPSIAPSPASAGGASEGFGPQARKTQSVKQGSNGPILRSGPIRSVAELRDPEPAEGASAGKTATQAVHLDAKSVIEQERASAEVGVAPPIAAGR
jgi:filamentous hemagglutinin family protein